MKLTDKLKSIGFNEFDINALTDNQIYQDGDGNLIEVLSDFTEDE